MIGTEIENNKVGGEEGKKKSRGRVQNDNLEQDQE